MIYADFNGSTPLCPEVKDYLIKRIQEGPFANPNAIHSLGRKIYGGLEKCRYLISQILDCETEQIIFNSGASEGISHIYFSALTPMNPEKNIIVTSKIEHSAVMKCNHYYQAQGYRLIEIPTTSDGQIHLEEYQKVIKQNAKNIALISIMAANNETGVIQPIQQISELAQAYQIPFFSDTTQYIGKTPFSFKKSGMDYACLSSHKVGSLIGSGLILVKEPTQLKPLIQGGGQESGHRGGTQNYIGIECMTVALEVFQKWKDNLPNVQKYREKFEDEMMAKFPELVVMGKNAPRLAGSCMLSLPGIHGQAVQIELESRDIFVTTSSACSDNQPETSRILKSMGVDDRVGRGVIRVSFCHQVDNSVYQQLKIALTETYEKLSRIHSF